MTEKEKLIAEARTKIEKLSQEVLDVSIKHIAERYSEQVLELDNDDRYENLTTPFNIEGQDYQCYGLRQVAYLEFDVKPTFDYAYFALIPSENRKNALVQQLEKREQDEPYDQQVIEDYYNPFYPTHPDIQGLLPLFSKLLSAFFEDGEFDYLTMVATANHNILLFFIDRAAFNQVIAAFYKLENN